MVKYTSLLSALIMPLAAMASYSSDCDPLKSSCPEDPALGGAISLDFTQKSEYFSNLYGEDRTKYTPDGLLQWFGNHGDSPSLRSNFYILFGKVEVVAKTPGGRGIIANFFLQADDGDEIDFEWISTYPTQVTTNYFGKGVTGNYDRGTIQDLGTNLNESYHTYTIDWTPEELTWAVDGKVIRSLKAAEVAHDGDHDYPVAPQRVFIGLWAGGDSDSQGVVEWAGGKTSLEGAPFIFNVKSFSAVDYSNGVSYSYDDTTGNKISINGHANSTSSTSIFNSSVSSTNAPIKPATSMEYQVQSLKTVSASVSLAAGPTTTGNLGTYITSDISSDFGSNYGSGSDSGSGFNVDESNPSYDSPLISVVSAVSTYASNFSIISQAPSVDLNLSNGVSSLKQNGLLAVAISAVAMLFSL